MMQRLRTVSHLHIIPHARRWFILSGIAVLISIGSLAFRDVNAGLEFSGGTAFRAEAQRDLSVQQVRDKFEEIGLAGVTVQEIGNRGFLVQGEHLAPAEQAEATKVFADTIGIEANEVNITTIGPKWGAQITSKAIRALIFFLLFTVAYLSFRLEWKMAVATMIALVHDLIITTGVYSLSGFEVTPSTVIALLTILGYSLYDNVVIFDRVKERTGGLSASGRVTYSEGANDALNQVLLRSFNTSIISIIPVGALLFVGSMLLGAQTLRELALALFVGLIAGSYSSVFIATPIVALWKEREERWSSLRKRIAARSTDPTLPSAPTPAATQVAPTAPGIATAVVDPDPEPQPAAQPAQPAKQKKRPQQRKKKRKHGRR